jgi:membrane protein YqaA with SNARE-associated domain
MEAPAPAPPIGREAVAAVMRLVLGVTIFLGAVALAGYVFRAELERFGTWFVGTFGPVGMALGAFLADGLHFPLPPQFYLLTGLAGGATLGVAFTSVLVGSVAGGLFAFSLARRAVRASFLERRTRASRALVEGLVRRHGLLGVAIAGTLPVSYFVLCSLGGLMRLPYRAYAVIAVMRVPRLLFTYLLIELAWKA